MRPKVFIACAGLGMGNASRIAAVIEALEKGPFAREHGLDIHVFSWGAGYKFLDEFKKKHQAQFSLGQLCSFEPEVNFLSYTKTYLKNTQILLSAHRRIKPDLIVLDSDYHFMAHLWSKKPILYIGQAGDVVRRAEDNKTRSWSFKERLNLLIRERGDFFLQRLFADLVLVPSFDPKKLKPVKGVQFIHLIVRDEFRSRPLMTNPKNDLGILLSGSQLHKKQFVDFADKFNLNVIAPDTHKHLIATSEDVDDFSSVIVQGGLSSISEVLARGKWLVVFPMENHPEQILNAQEIEELGFGVMAQLSDLNNLSELNQKINASKINQAARNRPECNGADEVRSAVEKNLSERFFAKANGPA